MRRRFAQRAGARVIENGQSAAPGPTGRPGSPPSPAAADQSGRRCAGVRNDKRRKRHVQPGGNLPQRRHRRARFITLNLPQHGFRHPVSSARRERLQPRCWRRVLSVAARCCAIFILPPDLYRQEYIPICLILQGVSRHITVRTGVLRSPHPHLVRYNTTVIEYLYVITHKRILCARLPFLFPLCWRVSSLYWWATPVQPPLSGRLLRLLALPRADRRLDDGPWPRHGYQHPCAERLA